ncbi:MAG: ornithine carbamoyltransferase [Candidatus Methylacidiphilales bacterium]
MPVKHFLKIQDLTQKEVRAIFTAAAHFKTARGSAAHPRPLEGQSWGLIFSKSSTRTRVSFETGIHEMGGRPMFLNTRDIQLGRGEPIRDTARVLGRMLHGLVCRTYDQAEIVELASYSNLPTINALTDEEHPCQILTDVFTYEEKRGSIRGRRIAFIGDAACNVSRSFVRAAELMDFQLVCAAPHGYQTNEVNDHVILTTDPEEAARGADLLYTDVWVSMGKEDESAARLEHFKGYQLNHELLRLAKPEALVLHCLPAYRGKEISEALLEDFADVIFEQAENRLHVQKAIIQALVERA